MSPKNRDFSARPFESIAHAQWLRAHRSRGLLMNVELHGAEDWRQNVHSGLRNVIHRAKQKYVTLTGNAGCAAVHTPHVQE